MNGGGFMRFFRTSVFPLVVLGIFVGGFSSSALSDTVRVDNEPPYDIALRGVTLHDGKVSGQIVNTSPNVVRDVQLLIRRTWLWKNEFHPGVAANDPGTADHITIKRQLRYGESTPFSYVYPPAQFPRSEGNFMTEVSVAGFTEVINYK
jgi:hypothetical protein